MKKIIIIGAGPTGLSAAYRLKRLGYNNFKIYERNSYPGGLCASFKDKKGFTWDLGGHVLFSRYKYYYALLKEVLGNNYLEHKRNAWIHTMGKWVPYPFQHNIKYLSDDIFKKCLNDFKKIYRKKKKAKNFKEWIINNMGEGIAEYFMLPYNFKVWAYPLDFLSYDWISERISTIVSKNVASLISHRNRVEWGPNAIFKHPLYNGTGEIFRKMSNYLNDELKLKTEIIKINPKLKKVYLANGRTEAYDILINTSPLDKFIKSIKNFDRNLKNISLKLKRNGVFVVGLGIKKVCHSKKYWIYFPDSNCPFFRVTYFSNYSPYNVPDIRKYHSLICESAYSDYKKESKTKIVEKTIQGLINTGMIKKSDRKYIVSTFLFDIDYAYPIPTLDRDTALKKIQTELEKMNIYSRGRFGTWKYEIGNTDHSIMQGKQIIDRILRKDKETIWKL